MPIILSRETLQPEANVEFPPEKKRELGAAWARAYIRKHPEIFDDLKKENQPE